MAWLDKPKKKDNRVSTFKKGEYQAIYQNPLWKKIRKAKFKKNPICEVCLLNDITSPTEEIHHIIPFKLGATPEEIKILAFSIENTISVCTKCHKELHANYKTDLELRLKLLGY